MAALFAAFWLYVWLRVDPSALYFWPSEAFPSFSMGSAFLSGFLAYPGGLAEYAAAFACQFYYLPWAGALIVAVVAALAGWGAWVYIRGVTGSRPRWLHLLPGVLSLVVWNWYAYDLAHATAWLMAVWSACAYLRLRRLGGVRLGVFIALLVLVHYLAAGASLLYTVLCVVCEVSEEDGLLRSMAYSLVGAVAPLGLAFLVFDVPLSEAYLRLLPSYRPGDLRSSTLDLCLYAFLPAMALAWVLWRRQQRGISATREALSAPGSQPSWAKAVGPVVFLVGTGFAVWFTFDQKRNAYLELERCARLGKWAALLQRARMIPAEEYDLLTRCDVNRALCHTGRLLDEMFAYPQEPGGVLLSPVRMVDTMGSAPFALMKFSDVLFDLGSISESEHMAHEVLSTLGPRPFVLERLAMVGIVKGQIDAARLHLWALSRDIFYRRRAVECLELLEDDPMLTADDEVRRLRSFRPVEDDPRDPSGEVLLERLVQRNKQNRMALEYLMAHYLADRRVGSVVSNIPRLRDVGYDRLPQHCEEAALIYETETQMEVVVRGWSVSPPTRERLRRFSEGLERCGGDARVARQALAKDFGGSYFFYYRLGPGARR